MSPKRPTEPPVEDTSASSVEQPDKFADLSYEEAREELVGIVRSLEAGAGLEESLRLWERGEALAQVCQQRLDGALARIEARTATDEGDTED